MSETTKQIDALRELHDPLPGDIQFLLDRAVEHDVQARALRAEAGRLLARLQSQDPGRWMDRAGVDARTAERLVAMGAGRD